MSSVSKDTQPAVPLPKALEVLKTQPLVQTFFARALAKDQIGQAYLFVGPSQSTLLEAAFAVCMSVLCPQGGDATCDECRRVQHQTHPDVHLFEPQSAQGYLIGQMRELLDDVALAPIRAKKKIYLISSCESFTAITANALLKTLEEPPRDVMFILLSQSLDAVLPTIVSRCTVIPFSAPTPVCEQEKLRLATGANPAQIELARAVTQNTQEAAQFLNDVHLKALRSHALDILLGLFEYDDWDVLKAVRELCAALKEDSSQNLSKEEKEQMEAAQKEQERIERDFLSAAAQKQQEQTKKRELTAAQKRAVALIYASINSCLRDMMLVDEMHNAPLVNYEREAAIRACAARTSTAQILVAFDAVAAAADKLSTNVSIQLTFEVVFLQIKEALSCPR